MVLLLICVLVQAFTFITIISKKFAALADVKMKSSMIENIVQKLSNISLSSIDLNNIANEENVDIISNIKEELKASPAALGNYSHTITEGVDLMVKEYLNVNDAKDTRRNNKGAAEVENTKKLKLMLRYTTPYTKKPSKNMKCVNVIDKTCIKLKSVQNFICKYDKNELPLDKICNHINDCLDKTDEQNCAEIAIEKIKRAGDIVTNLEAYVSNQCLTPDVASSLFTTQNQVLRNVLKSQLDFLETYPDIVERENYELEADFNNDTLMKLSNEAVLVVSSLAMALEGSLCTRRFGLDDIDEVAIRYSDIDVDEALDNVIKKAAWSPGTCLCNGPVCKLKDCHDLCKRICWQKYNLDRWTCHAIDTGPSISIDYICDGKYDCYDETDELDCYTGENFDKLDSDAIYKEIDKSIQTKIKLRKYGFVLSELLSLQDTVVSLQKLSIDTDVDTINVKIAREQYFSTIRDIHDRFVMMSRSIMELNEAYDYLVSLNRKVIEALKKSRTGNDRVIPTDGCTCKKNRCVLLRCSESCKKTCAVQYIFTRYSCDKKRSQFVQIEEVCNGLPDCSNEEDEIGCQKDACRVHHLVLIRHSIQKVGQKHKGTALGEALVAWKTKVTNTLLITERNGRPNRKILEDVIVEMLQDLIKTFATIEERKRISNDYNLNVFFNLSQQIIKILKSCKN